MNMKLTELWREPRVLTMVGLCTVVVSALNAPADFRKGVIWGGVFWSAFGVFFVFYSWGIYYWNVGQGARKMEEKEQRRRAELDRFLNT